MAKIKDISGQRFGRLIAIFPTDKRQNGSVIWHCKCDCGKFIDVNGGNLRDHKTKSCGCLAKETVSFLKTKDELGNKYGKLTIIKRDLEKNSLKNGVFWLCLCDCGNIASVLGKSLRIGQTHSCGCIKSKGEEKIANLLRINKILFIQEYSFNNLVGIGRDPLRFDFAILNKDKTLSYLIEYDGIQHFEKSHGVWGEKFDIIQIHDKLKNKYCKNNNIKLIRIKYNQNFEIGDLL